MESSAQILTKYLADSFYLYLKTHNYHWNVTGPLFFSLHKMFEEQYNELWLSLDQTAEKIRALSVTVPATTPELQKLTCLKEALKVPNAQEMLKDLFKDHEMLIHNLKKWITEDTANDAATQDYLMTRLESHEKTAWMLKSSF